MNLIPFPKNILNKKGFCELGRTDGAIALDVVPGNDIVRSASLNIAECLGKKGMRTVSFDNKNDAVIQLSFTSENLSSEAYRLTICREGIAIAGEGPRGVFHGSQTLVQLIRENGTTVPCLEIEDSPDYPVRGFLHDVTRGKVPTLATLKLLVDKLAFYKINHLQLYIEHAFAFRGIPELWQDKDPLTAEEIKELDLYCRDRCIDLVPSLATFGHLYELLRLKRYEHLNELDIKASVLPHNLWDRMAHYTIDVSNEESYVLIKSMIDEFVPLFSSGFCNICCDETFDLGKGKNRKLAEKAGTGRLYIDFVKILMTAVREHGKTPMIWGDVVLRHPELIGELPDDTVFLNWDYGAEVTGLAAKTFAAAGVKQYVCPGVQGWSRFANDINVASANIRKTARYGLENSAIGMLNTDWGDCGHVNLLSASFHGMALGAALSWNGASYPEDWQFDASFSALELGEYSGKIAQALRELGSLCFYHFGNMYAWVNEISGTWDKEREVESIGHAIIEKNYQRALKIFNVFGDLKASGKISGHEQDLEEFIWSARAIRWTLGLLAYKKRNDYNQLECSKMYQSKDKLLEEGALLLSRFEVLWRKRNNESELRNVKETFNKIFDRMERMPDV